MIFVETVHGMAPIIHAFLDFHGNKVSVNWVSYLNLLQGVAWPRLHQIANRSNFWCMQDGEWNFSFHEPQLWRSSHQPENWSSLASAHPGSESLDSHFWAAAQSQVYKEKPDSTHSSTARRPLPGAAVKKLQRRCARMFWSELCSLFRLKRTFWATL